MRIFLLAVLVGFCGNLMAEQPNLDQVREQYARWSADLLHQFETIRANGAACGFIGGRVAAAMENTIKESKATSALVDVAIAKRNQKVISAEIKDILKSNKEMESNLSTVLYGLEGPAQECKKARSAFLKMRQISVAMPGRLTTIQTAIASE